MVEIHFDERSPKEATGSGGVEGDDGATPSKAKYRRQAEHDYSSGVTASDEVPAILRNDPQVREYLRQLDARMSKKDRMISTLCAKMCNSWLQRSIFVLHRRAEAIIGRLLCDKSRGGTATLGTALENGWPLTMKGYQAFLWSEVRGDVRDRLRPPKEYR
ncbi:hypothetical protein RHGRI_014225 [Rhododendron griersonianum]|uniref:Uncharacterized protein n=1 Tax=Rhododendron griersonianum TaxID=479676 RepID=A0AAV6K8V2_9ERIC|nr:hypothetical protein RHGRI_014225 [Rhododendron griersonianum]